MLKTIQAFFETAMSRFFYSAPLSLGGGALAALAMAPLNAFYILPLSFLILYAVLLYAPSKKAAFLYAWLFGFGYFVFSLSWIGNALLVEGNDYRWAWPLAVSGLPAVLALFTASAGALTKWLFNLKSVSGFLGFVGCFALFEFLRGILFTGFPWNLFGYAWAGVPQMLQILFWTDTYFLSLLTVFWAGSFGFFLLSSKNKALPVLLTSIITMALCFGYGAYRLSHADMGVRDGVQIKIVQPNITQSEKWRRDKMVDHFAQMIAQSRASEEDNKTTYIVWPETAMSYWLMNDDGIRGSIKAMLYSYPQGANLFTGLLDYKTKGYTNSLVMLNKDARIVNEYHKSHLVPFGEYIPFQDYIPLAPVAKFQGFETGGGVVTQDTPEGLKYSPLICYEILFPYKAINEEDRPDFIVNVTNDAWYGISAGPYQHLTKAVFRAIETGVPVIRAANTGISAVVTPYGRIEKPSALFKNAVTTYQLPSNASERTFSTTFKTSFFLLILLGFICVGGVSKKINTNLD
jgi:apolipoprotein N-acyltransferase